jgi:hypothetical protein
MAMLRLALSSSTKPRFCRVTASEAIHSFCADGMDCFVASAQNCFAILSRAPLRKRFAFVAGNDDELLALR